MVLLLLLAVVFYWRFKYTSHFAGTWDQVDFALALDRFDLFAMQPHFPGYPYFILGGMAVHRWIDDPALALAVLNVLLSLLAAFPIYWLGRRTLAPLPASVLTVFIQTLSYVWVITGSSMSEGAAIAVLWWYLWSLRLALEKDSFLAKTAPLFFFGLLMGIRVSYAAFGVGVLLLWIADWKKYQGGWRRVALHFVIAVSFQLVWVAGLVLSEGSLTGFINMSLAFIDGHFNEWGGTSSSSFADIWNRAVRLVFYNFFWIGLSAQSVFSAIILAVLIVLAILSKRWTTTIDLKAFHIWLMTLGLAYFIWVLVAQNIDKPRHIAPLLGLSAFILFVSLFKYNQQAGWLYRVKWMLAVSLIALQTYHGLMLIQKQAAHPPATYQIAAYLEEMKGSFIVYTWEETRVMGYLRASYEHKRVYTYDYFLQEVNHRGGRTILLTNHVLQGFIAQGADVADRVTKVAEFSSDPLFDPIYHHIVLYEWKE